jgi:hypothetical protein
LPRRRPQSRVVGQQDVEREMLAVLERAHDDAARMIAPVGGIDRHRRVIVRDRLADEAVGRLLVEHRLAVAQHVDDGLVAQAMLVVRIDLAAGRVLVDAGPARAAGAGDEEAVGPCAAWKRRG